MIQKLGLFIASFALYSAACGQSVTTYNVPDSLESIEGKPELRYCSLWLSCKGGKVAQGNLLLESLDADKIEVPYRWRSAFEASLESDYQWLKSGGLNATIVLPVRRKHPFEEVGEVLLSKRKLTIPLGNNSGYGGGDNVPDAVLDRDNCYLIANEPRSKIVITSLDSKVGTKMWETTLPLVYSPGGQTGPGFDDGFRDVQFTDREGERFLCLWNHFAGEFMFAEIACSDGSIKTWFSSKIAIHPNTTQTTLTK